MLVYLAGAVYCIRDSVGISGLFLHCGVLTCAGGPGRSTLFKTYGIEGQVPVCSFTFPIHAEGLISET